MYVLMTGTGYVEILSSWGKIYTTRKLTLAKIYRTYSEAEEDSKKTETITKIKRFSNCDEIFNVSRNRKFIIELMNNKYLSISMLTDSQIIFKNVEYNNASSFNYSDAKSHYNSLLDLYKIKNWEEYQPINIKEWNNE